VVVHPPKNRAHQAFAQKLPTAGHPRNGAPPPPPRKRRNQDVAVKKKDMSEAEMRQLMQNSQSSQQQMPNWYKNGKKAADEEAWGFTSFLQMLLVIVMVGVVGMVMKGSDLTVEIPGLGRVNLKKAAQNLFPGVKKGVQQMDDSDDISLVNPAQSDYGGYGGGGSTYSSYKPSKACGGVVQGDSLLSAAPAAEVISFGVPREEDIGL